MSQLSLLTVITDLWRNPDQINLAFSRIRIGSVYNIVFLAADFCIRSAMGISLVSKYHY